MKLTRDLVLDYLEQELLKNNNSGLETRNIAEALGMQRTNVSTILNQLVKEEILIKTTTRPVRFQLKDALSRNTFEFPDIIGENGSLRTAVRLAQAAILYPNYALPVLVVSTVGSGRTYFVNKMIEFALQNRGFPQDTAFKEINCVDYNDDFSALVEILFGNETEESIFEKMEAGLLFIDNIQLLSVADQKRLVSWLNHRESRLREGKRKGVVIFGGDSKYSDVFANALPVVIQLPTYKSRPISEKLELVNHFFAVESKNSSRDIQVLRDVIQVLLLSKNIQNIKELEYAIRTACANAFVRSLRTRLQDVSVGLEDLPVDYQSIRNMGGSTAIKIDELIGIRKTLIYDKELGLLDFSDEGQSDLYSKIESQYTQLATRGIEQEDVLEMLKSYIQNYIGYDSLTVGEDDARHLIQLESIVSPEIIQLVQQFMFSIQKELNRKINATAYYGISLHIHAMIEKNSELDRRMDNDTIVKVIRDYPIEYAYCSRFAKTLETTFSITVPIDEIVILTLFIIESEKPQNRSKPVLLYVLHGKGVAQSLAASTQMLTKNNNIYGFDVLLEESTQESYQKLKSLLQDIDQGLGVLVLYDMGSIKVMLDKIRAETSIKIRDFEVPITMMGVSIARRCLIEEDVDTIFHTFNMEMNQFYQNHNQEKIIITLCYTSEGGALQLKHYINQYSNLGYQIIALSVSNKEALLEEVIALRKTYRIHAFVGTFDPKIMGIPFISMKDVFEQPKEMLDKLLMFMPVGINSCDYEKVYQALDEQFTYTPIAKLKRYMPSVLNQFSSYYTLTEDQTIGLFTHIACLIERAYTGEVVEKNRQGIQEMLDKFPEDYKNVRKIMRSIERPFKILVDDFEMGVIVRILKKL